MNLTFIEKMSFAHRRIVCDFLLQAVFHDDTVSTYLWVGTLDNLVQHGVLRRIQDANEFGFVVYALDEGIDKEALRVWLSLRDGAEEEYYEA